MEARLNRRLGITEAYWTGLSEDKKFKWKIFTRIITLITALTVTKSGILFLDWSVAATTTILSVLLIDTQRTYTRYSIKFRKILVRISIVLGAWCAVFLGVIYFSQVAIFAIASTLSSSPSINSDTKHQELKLVIYISVFFFGSLYGVLKSFRDLNIEELIYHVPRRQLKRLLIQRKFKANNFFSFAYFELGVIATTLVYSSGVGVLLGGVVKLMLIGLDSF